MLLRQIEVPSHELNTPVAIAAQVGCSYLCRHRNGSTEIRHSVGKGGGGGGFMVQKFGDGRDTHLTASQMVAICPVE